MVYQRAPNWAQQRVVDLDDEDLHREMRNEFHEGSSVNHADIGGSLSGEELENYELAIWNEMARRWMATREKGIEEGQMACHEFFPSLNPGDSPLSLSDAE